LVAWLENQGLRNEQQQPMNTLTTLWTRILPTAVLLLTLSGCAVVAVADAAVTVVATGVKVTAKAVGAVADAVIPDDEEE
jgi:hypothetical protein